SSEETVVFIGSIHILHWIFFSKWEHRHFVHIQDAFQLRVTFEFDPVKVISFSFLPIGSYKQIYHRINLRVSSVYEAFKAYSHVVNPVAHVINHSKLFSIQKITVVYSANVGQKVESKLRIFFQKLHYFKIL